MSKSGLSKFKITVLVLGSYLATGSLTPKPLASRLICPSNVLNNLSATSRVWLIFSSFGVNPSIASPVPKGSTDSNGIFSF